MAYRGALGGIGRGTPVVDESAPAQRPAPGQGFDAWFQPRPTDPEPGFGGGQGGGWGANRRSDGCHICHDPNHYARECPQRQQRSDECHICHETGHFARECPQKQQRQNDEKKDGGFGGFGASGGKDDGKGQRDNNCRYCHQEGHFINECPELADKICFNCKEKGHPTIRCPNPRVPMTCHRCGDDHKVSDCNLPPARRRDDDEVETKCYKCDQIGHIAKNCPKEIGEISGPNANRMPAVFIPTEDSLDVLRSQQIPVGINFETCCGIPVEYSGPGKMLKPCNFLMATHFPDVLFTNIGIAGFQRLTPIQQHAIPYVQKGKDLLGMAPTGSGKTAAYLLPLLAKLIEKPPVLVPNADQIKPFVLILTPTRELTKQVKDHARKFVAGTPIQIFAVYGGTHVENQKEKLKKSGCHVMVACLGRVLEWMNKGFISLSQCENLVVDEADIMLLMENEIDLRRLIETSDIPPKTERHTFMFSATFPFDIQSLGRDYMHEYSTINIGKVGATNHDIVQEFELVEQRSKKMMLQEMVKTNKFKEDGDKKIRKTIIFMERKRNADFFALFISELGTKAVSIHGDRTQEQREEALAMFRRPDDTSILVCTDVCARGLDILGVDLVVNFDMPQEIDQYVHRIGRTGRIGNPGKALSFFDMESDRPLALQLAMKLVEAKQVVPEWLMEAAEKDPDYMPF